MDIDGQIDLVMETGLVLGSLVSSNNSPGDQATEGSIRLLSQKRKTLLEYYRKLNDPVIQLRTHVLLWLVDGYFWNVIGWLLYTSPSTIAGWKQRFGQEGLNAIVKLKLKLTRHPATLQRLGR